MVGGTGKGSISDITNFLSKEGIGTSEAEIASWIKSQPDIMGQIAKSSDSIMKQASEVVFNKLKLTNIFDQKSIDAITNTLKLSLDDEFSADSIIIRVDGAISSLRKVLSEKGKNAEVEDLIKKLEDKKKIAQNYKTSPMDASQMVKSADDVASEVSDNINMGKNDLLSFIDDAFPGNTSMKNDIESISEDDLIKLQDEFNKLSDEEVDDSINKVCGNLKEIFGKTYCQTDIDQLNLQRRGLEAQAGEVKAKTDLSKAKSELFNTRARKVGRFIKWTLIVGGAGAAYYYGKEAIDNYQDKKRRPRI